MKGFKGYVGFVAQALCSANACADLPQSSILSRYGVTTDQLPSPPNTAPVRARVSRPWRGPRPASCMFKPVQPCAAPGAWLKLSWSYGWLLKSKACMVCFLTVECRQCSQPPRHWPCPPPPAPGRP